MSENENSHPKLGLCEPCRSTLSDETQRGPCLLRTQTDGLISQVRQETDPLDPDVAKARLSNFSQNAAKRGCLYIQGTKNYALPQFSKRFAYLAVGHALNHSRPKEK